MPVFIAVIKFIITLINDSIFLFFLSEFLNGFQKLYSFCFESISVYDWNPFRNYDLGKELIIVWNLDKKGN